MARATARERAAERLVVSLAEAAVLVGYLGKEVEGVVVDIDAKRDVATVQLVRPAVVTEVALGDGPPALGDEVRLRVAAADPQTRVVQVELLP